MNNTNSLDRGITLNSVGSYYWRKKGYLRKEKFWALKDVSFQLTHGESLGVIGKNGAGKSTLLRLLAGIVKPDKGELINPGFTATLLSLQIGFVPWLTARQNAILSGLLLGMRRAKVEALMENIRGFSELGEFFDQPISTYSSGMKARLGFAVAFQLDPDILLIDEVLAVGDEDFRKKSQVIMHEKIRSDKTIVLVSNSMPVVKQLCDRVIWIHDGVTMASGEPEAVIREYTRHLEQGA